MAFVGVHGVVGDGEHHARLEHDHEGAVVDALGLQVAVSSGIVDLAGNWWNGRPRFGKKRWTMEIGNKH